MLRPVRSSGQKFSAPSFVHDVSLCVLSAILLILSFPWFHGQILAWLAFVPLLAAVENKTRFGSFLLCFLCGVVFWAATIYWLIHVTLAGTAVLVLYLALYFGLFGLLIHAIRNKPYAIRLFFIPAAWVSLEYARSYLLTGFPWALLGYSQYRTLPVIQIADITGAWGVSFLVMMVNAALYAVIGYRLSASAKRKTGREAVKLHDHTTAVSPLSGFRCSWSGIPPVPQSGTGCGAKIIFIPLVLVVCVLGYGFFRLQPAPAAGNQRSIKISVIQANIPQDLKWYPGARGMIVEKYILISREALLDHPDLVIWPEAALPVILEQEPDYFRQVVDFCRANRVSVLLGAVTARDEQYYNSALLVSADGEIAGQYDKIHLVPFGEYIPLKKILPFLETIVPIGDITRGKEFTVFGAYLTGGAAHSLKIHFSVLICFEDVFPDLSRAFVARGADLLVNITNDAWYKRTAAGFQHFQASVFRAVENRMPLVRSANTGVSGFISPEGRIIALVQDSSGNAIFVDGYTTRSIACARTPETFYTRWGDWFVFVCFALVWFLSGIWRKVCPVCAWRACKKEA